MSPENMRRDPDEAASSKNYQEAREILKDKTKLLETLMSSMGDGLSIQDADMRIVYQNRFMIENFGEHLGEYCYNVYERRDKLCEGCPIAEAYKTEKVTKALRTGITKDGTPFRFENIASVLKNDRGKVVAGVELCRIVEDREKALDELKKSSKTLETFNKIAVGREMRVLELKKQVNAMLKELGRSPEYP
ncbi:MAG: PAS domain-containing protein [Candidatus Omnitrophota bacterium]